MLPTNNDEILSICANFESKDSAGYDEISSTIAKAAMQCTISPLIDIINCSFETGITECCKDNCVFSSSLKTWLL